VVRSLRETVEEMRRAETILVIAPTPFLSGVEGDARILEEVRILGDLGYRIEVCTAPGGRDVEGVAVHRAARVPRLGADPRGPSLRRLLADLLLLGTAQSVLRRTRPCLILAHRHGGALLGGILGRLHGIPCVAELPGSVTRELAARALARRSPVVRGCLRAVERWIDGLPDHLVVRSVAMAEDLRARFGVATDRVTLVPDAVGSGFGVESSPGAGGVRPADGRRVVACMDVAEPETIDVLAETIARVLAARRDVSFLVLGDAGETRLRARLASARARGRVAFAGAADHGAVASALVRADLAVSARLSETEGDGLLVLAMATGLPAVAFETPIHREILGPLGIWAAGRSAETLAARVLDALRAPDELRRLGPALRARSAERASWERNRRLLADVCGRLRAAAGRGAP
jgi:glycosyltransferase involved in cell wall biosynthesis